MDSHPQGVSLCRTQHPGIPWKLRFREIGPLLGSLTHPLPTTQKNPALPTHYPVCDPLRYFPPAKSPSLISRSYSRSQLIVSDSEKALCRIPKLPHYLNVTFYGIHSNVQRVASFSIFTFHASHLLFFISIPASLNDATVYLLVLCRDILCLIIII